MCYEACASDSPGEELFDVLRLRSVQVRSSGSGDLLLAQGHVEEHRLVRLRPWKLLESETSNEIQVAAIIVEVSPRGQLPGELIFTHANSLTSGF